MRKYLFARLWLVPLCCVGLAPVPARAGVLWYTGDTNGTNALGNNDGGAYTAAEVYNNFVVGAAGWHITGLFTNNIMDYTGVNTVDWSIRTGVSSGNGGVLVAGGGGTPASQVLTGRTSQGLSEYTVEVDGLNINLAAGTYWFNVTPVGQGGGNGYSAQTSTNTPSGPNAVGIPGGFTSSVFWSSTDDSANFQGPQSGTLGPSSQGSGSEFSDGVVGTVNSTNNPVPEPATLTLLAAGVGSLLLSRARRLRGAARR